MFSNIDQNKSNQNLRQRMFIMVAMLLVLFTTKVKKHIGIGHGSYFLKVKICQILSNAPN